MIPFDADLQPLRRAALLVHALPDADARWLLDALSAQERAALDPLLSELRLLGLPRDPTLVTELEGQSRSPVPVLDAGLARLDRHGVAQLENLLRAEPVCVTTRLLAAGAWPWRARIARGIGVAVPASASPEQPGGGAALRHALLQAVEQALSATTAPSPGGALGWWAGLWQRVRCTRSAP
jgi:hypothetical protein